MAFCLAPEDKQRYVMLYDVGISGTRSLRPELFGLSDSCGAHSSYTVLDDQSPINPKNLKNKNTFKMAATLLAQPTGSSQSDSAISVPESENSVRIGDQTVGSLTISPPSLVGNLPPPLVDEALLDRSIFGELPIIHVVKKMVLLMLSKSNGQVGSAIPASYGRTASWDKFTAGQKTKVRQAWLKSLNEAQRISVRAEIQVIIDSARDIERRHES